MSTEERKFLRELRAIGDRLKTERLAMGLKQEEFAELGNVKLASQSNYEGGRSHLGIDYLLHLSEHGVDIGYVVTGIRQDGSLGYMEQDFLDKFRRLEDAEKEILFVMVCKMLGEEIDIRQFMQADPMPATLHSPRIGFTPKPADD